MNKRFVLVLALSLGCSAKKPVTPDVMHSNVVPVAPDKVTVVVAVAPATIKAGTRALMTVRATSSKSTMASLVWDCGNGLALNGAHPPYGSLAAPLKVPLSGTLPTQQWCLYKKAGTFTPSVLGVDLLGVQSKGTATVVVQ